MVIFATQATCGEHFEVPKRTVTRAARSNWDVRKAVTQNTRPFSEFYWIFRIIREIQNVQIPNVSRERKAELHHWAHWQGPETWKRLQCQHCQISARFRISRLEIAGNSLTIYGAVHGSDSVCPGSPWCWSTLTVHTPSMHWPRLHLDCGRVCFNENNEMNRERTV